ncbi:TetR/AcrR family transcriptional regulator [Luteibacter aegosomaticola]|uniref:TetR/AcrR family transcriptional regulator n=1 Tax=Luteibacter aegosomaticola TaxID=2911538 RepID=UPI001FF854C6|nr:TetR/AcrR family transcriptional regulator [Luteibacter aegosomaticola]UPG89981.1 TetR/AcrR family transcriptional regulator [Luteibacter aegosomaticola]
MPKPRKVEDDELTLQLTRIFKEVGYDAASLAVLSEATGLKKASLYHRFPGGKEQMAEEVLSATADVLEANLFPLLEDASKPEKKMAAFVRIIDTFYASGNESCLLNVLAPPRGEQNGRATAIASIFQRLSQGLTRVAEEAGATKRMAKVYAEQALVELHGALILSRGTGDTQVFGRMLTRLPAIILRPS